MNCQEGMELMQRHVDRDLSEEETARLMDHVGHCPDCAVMLERLVRLSRGLEQLPRVVPPYSLVDAILPELDRGEASPGAGDAGASAPPEPRSRRAERARRAWFVRVSGVVAAGVVVGLLLVNGPLGRLGSSHRDAASSPGAESRQEAGAANTPFTAQDQIGSTPPASQSSASTFKSDVTAPSAESGKSLSQPSASEGLSKRTDASRSSPSADAAPAPEAEPAQPKASESDSAADAAPSVQPRVKDGGASPDATKDDANQSFSNGANQGLTDGSADQAHPDGEAHQGLTANPPGPESSSTAPMASIMGEQPAAEEAWSPDGQWRAVLTDGKLQVYRQSDGRLVYDQVPDEGKRSGLSWSEDSKALNYTYTDAEGHASARTLQVPEMKEKTR